MKMFFPLGKGRIYTYCKFLLDQIHFVPLVHYSVLNLETHGVDHFFKGLQLFCGRGWVLRECGGSEMGCYILHILFLSFEKHF